MSFTTRPELRGTFGMVASTHWLASAAGMAVLEQGGNAFDAAVAAGLHAAGRRAAPERPRRRPARAALAAPGGEPVVLCAQGPAPRAATIERYRDELGLELVPGTGPLAAVVPGAFGGWLAMLRDHGTLPLRRRAALRDPLRGGRLSDAAADRRRDPERRALFRDEWTTSAELYLPVPEPGTLHRNPHARRDVPADRSTRRARIGEQIEAARDSGTAASSPRRSSRFQAARVDGQLRRAPPRAARGRRPGATGGRRTSRRCRSTTTA